MTPSIEGSEPGHDTSSPWGLPPRRLSFLAGRGWAVPLFIASSIYLYAELFYPSGVPILLRGDQTYFWVYAERILAGETVYRDFFQFTPPGLDFLFVTFFHFFGEHIWVLNLAILFLGVALCLFCFCLACNFMSRSAAALAAAAFVVLLYGSRLDATHHWISSVMVLASGAVLYPDRSLKRLTLSGSLLGIASFFTQTAGMFGLAALFAALVCDKPPRIDTVRKQIQLGAAFVLTFVTLMLPFVLTTGLRRIWFLLITYPRRYVIYDHQFLLPSTTGWRTGHWPVAIGEVLFIYLSMLLIYPIALWQGWRTRRDVQNGKRPIAVLVFLLTALSLLLEIVTRLNPIRIFSIAMPAIIVTIAALDRTHRRRASLTIAAVLIAAVAVWQVSSQHNNRYRLMYLPAGRAMVNSEDFEIFTWLQQHTHPGDFFFQAAWLNIYPPLKLRSPVFVDGLWPINVTRPEFVDLTVKQLDSKPVKYILWAPRWQSPATLGPSSEDHLDPFRHYLQSHYALIHIFSDGDEIWERRVQSLGHSR